MHRRCDDNGFFVKKKYIYIYNKAFRWFHYIIGESYKYLSIHFSSQYSDNN